MASDEELLTAIGERAYAHYKRLGVEIKSEVTIAELRTVHETIMPLRLQDLLDADGEDFWYDIGGIRAHLVRGQPGHLREFVPKFAA